MKSLSNKYYIILLAVTLQITWVYAQNESKIKVETTTKEVGKILSTQHSINAVEYTFPERIHDFTIDTINKYLTIQLRGLSNNGKWLDNKGDVVRYSITNNKVLWSKSIAYQTQTLDQYNGVTVRTAGGKSYVLDNENGEPLWEMKNSLVYIAGGKNIALGYKFSGGKASEDALESINLKDGSTLWTRKISRKYGFDNVFRLNDSTLLIAAAGLHTANLKNGTGWDFDAITGKLDYTSSALGTGLGIAAGILTDMYSVSTGHDVIRNVSSNILSDSLNFYFASKTSIAKLNKKGDVVWQTPLTEDESSKSIITKIGANILLVNWGYANIGSKKVNFGIPFIASYDSNTGKANFKINLTTTKESIEDFKMIDDAVIIVFANRIEKYSILDGKLLATYNANIEKNGELNTLLGNQVFVKKGDAYISLTASSPQQIFVYTKKDRLVVLDQSLNVNEETGLTDFYLSNIRTNGLVFLRKQKENVIINAEGKEIAQFTAEKPGVLLNKKLYTTNDKSFLEIDLAELLTK